MSKLSGLLTKSTVILIYLFFLTVPLAAFDQYDLQGLDLIKEVKSAGYPIEFYHVFTEDDYILTMHRIEHKKLSRSSSEEMFQQPVVLLMHGMMKTSASFINQGPNRNFAYNLADAGYDVWLGNARGNPYSRAHHFLNPDDYLDQFIFFNFTWEDIGTKDISAMVEYFTAETGADRITFVGDAEGATSFLILNSLKPEYNEKFNLAVLLNPIGYTDNFPFAELKIVASMVDSLYNLAQEQGIVEISSLNLHLDTSDGELSSGLVFRSVVSYIASLGDFTRIGTSLKQIIHSGQNIRDKSFRRWNYGQSTNQINYGTDFPPSYNISRVTVETVIYYRMGNHFLDERDVQAMANDMPAASVKIFNDTEIPIRYLTDMF